MCVSFFCAVTITFSVCLSDCLQVLRTFLRLQLHHIDVPVGAAGTSSSSQTGRNRKETRARLAKMTKKQKKVPHIYVH